MKLIDVLLSLKNRSYFGEDITSPLSTVAEVEALHRLDTRSSTSNLNHQYNYYDGLNGQPELIIRDANFSDTITVGENTITSTISDGENLITKEHHLPFNYETTMGGCRVKRWFSFFHTLYLICKMLGILKMKMTILNGGMEVAYRGRRRHRISR